jgi:hypothetical protein
LPHAACSGKSGEDERAMDRDKLVTGMLIGVSPALSAEQVAKIYAALRAFSDKL